MVLFFCAAQGLADDLNPEPFDQAVEKYKGLWHSKETDPMNHEIWKLYIRTILSPTDGYDKTPKLLIAALKTNGGYRVMLQINQLYNYLQQSPKPGDVIVVEGRVTGHYQYHITTQNRNFTMEALSMYSEGAENLPKEHFDPSATKSSRLPFNFPRRQPPVDLGINF